VRRENPGEHAHRGSRVAAVERFLRHPEATKAAAVDVHGRAVAANRDAELREAVERRRAIGAGGVPCQGRGSLGERAEQCITMRDRLVARQVHQAAYVRGGLDRFDRVLSVRHRVRTITPDSVRMMRPLRAGAVRSLTPFEGLW
jgi:hypothetical protein